MKKYKCQLCGKRTQAAKLSVECIVCGAVIWLPWTHESCVAKARRNLDHGHTVEEIVEGDVQYTRRLRLARPHWQKKLRYW